MRTHCRQVRLQVNEQAQERLAHVVLVLLLVRSEPGLVVVFGQGAQEFETGI